MGSIRRALVFLGLTLAAAGLTSIPAGVGVEVDMETLNRLLGAVTRTRFDVQLPVGTQVTVELQDLRVTGLAPATKDKQHSILTAVTLVAPDIGLRVPLKPRVVLDVVQESGASLLELRFEDAGLAVPLVGRLNFARLAKPLRFPADNEFLIEGAEGNVPITSKLKNIEMGRDTIRFEFDVAVPAKP